MTELNAQRRGGIDIMRKAVMDLQQREGELVWLLEMYNPQNSQGVDRCSYCFDPAYGTPNPVNGPFCTHCFGTTYEGGIKQAFLLYALVGKPNYQNQVKPKGQIAIQNMQFQFPWYAKVWEFDYVIRMNGFVETDGGYLPAQSIAYQLQTPTYSVLKDGLNYVGEEEVIGVKAQGSLVHTNNPIPYTFAVKKTSPIAPSFNQGEIAPLDIYSAPLQLNNLNPVLKTMENKKQ